MLQMPNCLDNWLTEGGEFVSLMRRPPLHFPEIHFHLRLSKAQGRVRQEGLGKLIQIIHIIGSLTSDLPACGMVA
jgi:hypothetical protein